MRFSRLPVWRDACGGRADADTHCRLQQLEAFDVQRGMFRNLLHSVERETRLKDAVGGGKDDK